jgi:hypothetical protein
MRRQRPRPSTLVTPPLSHKKGSGPQVMTAHSVALPAALAVVKVAPGLGSARIAILPLSQEPSNQASVSFDRKRGPRGVDCVSLSKLDSAHFIVLKSVTVYVIYIIGETDFCLNTMYTPIPLYWSNVNLDIYLHIL